MDGWMDGWISIYNSSMHTLCDVYSSALSVEGAVIRSCSCSSAPNEGTIRDSGHLCHRNNFISPQLSDC